MPENDPLTERILACVYAVANTLGHGFVEKVYENALAVELRSAGLAFTQQQPIQVHYSVERVGEFAADLVVEGRVIVELKAVKALDDIHLAQCLNYLKAASQDVCLLINFGRPRIEVRRLVSKGEKTY